MLAHVDADSFFASALIRKRPHLRGKPLLALGMGGGCVIAATYEAKAFGVKTGMPLKDARKLVPHAIAIPADFEEAGLASDQIEDMLKGQCPIVEQMSVDEWYLDLKALPGGYPANFRTWALGIQRTVGSATGITVSIGVGPTKTLAKMAGEYRKPAGVTVVDRIQSADVMDFESFLKDRPAAAVPGIGRKRTVHADAHGWITAWDFARANPQMVKSLFGKTGDELRRELNGEAVWPIVSKRALPKSVSRCRSFRSTRDPTILFAHVLRHLEYTVLKMRRHELACGGVSVWLRDGEYHSAATHESLAQLANTEDEILPSTQRCFGRIHQSSRAYTQTGLALWGLHPVATKQYSLFRKPESIDQEEELQRALDKVHVRFGRNAISRGSAMPVKSGTKRTLDIAEAM